MKNYNEPRNPLARLAELGKSYHTFHEAALLYNTWNSVYFGLSQHDAWPHLS